MCPSSTKEKTMRNWFISADDGRLRALWRIGVFLLFFAGINTILAVSARSLLGGLPRTSVLVFVLLAVSATAATWLARRFIDKKSFVSLGLARPLAAWQDLVFGFLLSGLMALLVFAALLALGFIDNVRLGISAVELAAVLMPALAVTVLVGYWEELVFRGYLLQNMIEGLGLRVAVVLSCVLYGAVHAMNDNAGIVSTLIIMLFGYLRIYGYLATRLLWLSMGMHIGWNFFQGPVFGFPASGHIEPQTIVAHERVGPGWLSGADFGPEASVITIPVLLLALWLMRLWAGRKSRA
jgi:membrane protease YdiL (CAAX protease family)